jgi:hypothetical protein
MTGFFAHMRKFVALDAEEEAVLAQFVQRIPQYIIASYLGFTPEFVSKIKTRRK